MLKYIVVAVADAVYDSSISPVLIEGGSCLPTNLCDRTLLFSYDQPARIFIIDDLDRITDPTHASAMLWCLSRICFYHIIVVLSPT